MVGSALNIGLSGLIAASTKLKVGANNIANIQSTTTFKDGEFLEEPYTPQEVSQSAALDGSVITQIQDSSNPTVPVYQPDSDLADADGFVDYPNVDLAQELIKINQASNDYTAAANIIKVQDKITDTALDILG